MFLQPADALSAFANGQGNAWVIWDPYTAQANLTHKVRSIGSADNGYQFARKYSAAVGMNLAVSALVQSRLRRLPVPLDNKVVGAEQRLAKLFAAAERIPEAPDFVAWVDRRFNGVHARERHELTTTRR